MSSRGGIGIQKIPILTGIGISAQGLALTSFLRSCFLRFHNTSVLVVTETFLEPSIGFQADFLCCHKIKYLIKNYCLLKLLFIKIIVY